MTIINACKSYLQNYFQSAHFKKKIIGAILFLILLFFIYKWIFGGHSISTDDAYVNANIVQISPQISGRVNQVYVRNNEHVKKGQPLFDIDPDIYQIAVNRARAELSQAYQSVEEKKAAVLAARAEVAVRKAEWIVAKSTAERTLKLVKRRVLSQQTGDDAAASLQRAIASLAAAQANLDKATIDLGQSSDENNQIQLAKANLQNAELHLSYTQVKAPCEGVIANLTLRAGTVVTTFQPLFALINNGEFWIDTNLKETDLKNISPGQTAEIHVDMYRGHVFKGVVESISPGSGAVFSLLPPQNATGNWVKITQRVPVRVKVTDTLAKFPLRIGTSATVKIKI